MNGVYEPVRAWRRPGHDRTAGGRPAGLPAEPVWPKRLRPTGFAAGGPRTHTGSVRLVAQTDHPRPGPPRSAKSPLM